VTRRQQVVLGALGAAVLLALVSLLLLSADGGDEEVDAAGGTTTTTVVPGSSTTTSTTLLVTTTAVVTTTIAAAPVVTGPPTTTAPPLVTGEGALLRPVAGNEVRTVAPGVGCEGLADAGWDPQCGVVTAKGAQLVWLVESRTVPGDATARRAYVFRRVGNQQWRPVLRARDEAGTRFAAVRTRVEDPSGDGASEIAFGFTMAGNGALAVDLVEGPGTVVVHRELALGRARVGRGQLDLWRALTPGGSTYAHEVIRYQAGGWRLVASTTVRGSDVPPSEL
jgi:hypothetical protein